MNRAIGFIGLLLAGCSTGTPQTSAAAQIVLESQCRGVPDCASYRVSITSDGVQRYEGLGGVALLETVETAPGRERWNDADAVLTRANWSALPITLPEDCTSNRGLPSTAIITKRVDSVSKTVTYLHACEGDASATKLFNDLDTVLLGPRPRYPP